MSTKHGLKAIGYSQQSQIVRRSGQLNGAARRWGNQQAGKIGWAILWLLGVPLPVLLIIYLIRGH